MIRNLCALMAVPFLASYATAEPSFDCAKAESDAEVAICGSTALSQLDVEVSRLYGLALAGPNMTDERASELKALQRGWIKGRDECWKASGGLETCIAAAYGMRIDALRTGYADARVGEGASSGPFAYACDGLGALVSAVFVMGEAPLVSLRWRDVEVVLPQVPAASGTKYASDDYREGTITFWTQGTDALLETSDGQTVSCVEDDIG